MTEESEVFMLDGAPEKDPNRVLKDVLAGTVGGIAQVLSGQPFDTTKVRLQSAAEGTYSGPIDVVKQLLKNEGPLGFYKGTLTPLVGVGACVSIQFGVNEFMKRFFAEQQLKKNIPAGTPLTSSQFYICGAAGGFANGFLAAPIEHIRIRLQTQTGAVKEFNGPLDTIRKLYAQNGLKTIYRGIWPTLIREAHGIGIYFMTFEALVKNEMTSRKVERKEIPGWKLCSFGAAAGYSMWLTSYPIDVIKSKLQTDSYTQPKFRGSLDVAKSIMATNGIKGFFKGFVPTILRAAPANAATFYAFELTMRFLG
ncbi:unnamed protein product [Kuraishia capsulata CBS 1993]|uniref:Uncharacterized protein n=1 Tax=Kuraishia capsulata CBS 1993 TaxID=1382522 RepID=W6MXS3_9ASCO|nr:uncharacterized protein KUCA_T00005378001 [Kuraishia capsulata CBS 1993]CDK29390.1 unnamed protein product [Kuraishia capsulata CBS 1993]